MTAKYPKKINMIRVSEETRERVSKVMLRSGNGEQQTVRTFLSIGLTIYEYYERRGITDVNRIKAIVLDELGKKQLKLPFDK